MIACVDFLPTALMLDRSRSRWVSGLSFFTGMALIAVTLIAEGL
jgi:hypothetical protein